MTKRFSEVDGSEEVVLTYDFTNGLAAGETLLTPAVEVVVTFGEDPQAASIVGTPQVDGPRVLVPISGQKEPMDYKITVICSTSNPNKTLALAGVLPVRAA